MSKPPLRARMGNDGASWSARRGGTAFQPVDHSTGTCRDDPASSMRWEYHMTPEAVRPGVESARSGSRAPAGGLRPREAYSLQGWHAGTVCAPAGPFKNRPRARCVATRIHLHGRPLARWRAAPSGVWWASVGRLFICDRRRARARRDTSATAVSTNAEASCSSRRSCGQHSGHAVLHSCTLVWAGAPSPSRIRWRRHEDGYQVRPR